MKLRALVRKSLARANTMDRVAELAISAVVLSTMIYDVLSLGALTGA